VARPSTVHEPVAFSQRLEGSVVVVPAVKDQQVVTTEVFYVRGDVELEEQRYPLAAEACRPLLALFEAGPAAHRIPCRPGQRLRSDLDRVRTQPDPHIRHLSFDHPLTLLLAYDTSRTVFTVGGL
jgi:hypothetical protein